MASVVNNENNKTNYANQLAGVRPSWRETSALASLTLLVAAMSFSEGGALSELSLGSKIMAIGAPLLPVVASKLYSACANLLPNRKKITPVIDRATSPPPAQNSDITPNEKSPPDNVLTGRRNRLADKLVIAITGYVEEDGMGDFHHMLNTAKYVQSIYPQAQIVMAVNPKKLSERESKFRNIDSFLETPDQLTEESKRCFFVWDDYRNNPEDLTKQRECLELLRKASLIFEVSYPTSIKLLCKNRAELARIPRIRIAEFEARSIRIAGEDSGSSWTPARNKVTIEQDMGFHAEENGVFWPNPVRENAQVDTLRNEQLRLTLCNNIPNSAHYNQSNILHFAYFSPKFCLFFT